MNNEKEIKEIREIKETEEVKKKSDLCAREKFDFDKLVRDIPYLLSCTYQETEEEVTFKYNMTGKKSMQELKQEERRSQYRFLINFRKLEEIAKDYQIPLTEDNVYYDENLLPFIKHRDLYEKGKQEKPEEFLFLYKTFIGGILGKKYSVVTLQESGLEVVKNEPSFEAFYKAATAEELELLLRKREAAYIKDQQARTIRVGKNGYQVKTIISILAPILLAASLSGLFYMGRILIPFQRSIIAASESYVEGDYVTCIDSMRDIEPEQMDATTKYMLAVSYARSESLRKEEIESIVSKLSIASHERELEYWIRLGRMEAMEAQELAQALSNDQLLIYAYMKELDQLESDTSVDGEEKQNRISTLQDNIKSLGEQYTSTEEDGEEANEDDASTEDADSTKTQGNQADTNAEEGE